MEKLNELSMFFPCYNEEQNVSALIEEAISAADRFAQNFEILIINDGSSDKTEELAEEYAGKDNRVRVVTQKNMGYGAAVVRGFRESKYSWVFFSDGDLQFKLAELEKLVERSAESDLIVGYREKRADPPLRILNARLLQIWARVFLGFPPGIRDINCAFKLIKKDLLNAFEPWFASGAMINTELFIKANLLEVAAIQIPVTHLPRVLGEQTGGNPLVILRAVLETFSLRKKIQDWKANS